MFSLRAQVIEGVSCVGDPSTVPDSRGIDPRNILGPSSQLLFGMPRNQARSTFECEIVPKPGQSHDRSASKTDQEIDMGYAPEQPGRKAGQAKPAQLRDGELTSDRRKCTIITVAKRSLGVSTPAGE